MGLLIKADLETSAGATEKAYARIDTYRVDKVSSTVSFAVTYWKNKKAAHKYNRTYLEDKLKNATGLFANKVVLYKENDSIGTELELPTFIKLDLAKKVTVKEPILERAVIERSVPYVSFNSKGEEITKYRMAEQTIEKEVGENVIEKYIVDNSVLSDLPTFCYNHLKEEINSRLPGVEVITI